MTDTPAVNEATPESKPGASADKKAAVEKVLGDILRLMELTARLDIKDAADGSLSVAIHFEGEIPGLQTGRRSHVIDSLQVIVNKIVNRPGQERRWVSIGDPRSEPSGRIAEKLRPRPERKGWSKFKHGTSVPYSATRGLFQIEHLSMR